jgi:hypothetical protein
LRETKTASSRSGGGADSPAVAHDRKDTATPADQAPSSTAAVCQCGGNSTAALPPELRPQPSRSRLAARADQLPSSAALSSVRSPVASSQ